MLIGQTVPFTIDFVDKDGNPTVYSGTTPVVSLSDTTLGTLTVAADGLSGSFVASALGSETVSATADVPVTSASVDVTAGPPVSGAVKFGTPA